MEIGDTITFAVIPEIAGVNSIDQLQAFAAGNVGQSRLVTFIRNDHICMRIIRIVDQAILLSNPVQTCTSQSALDSSRSRSIQLHNGIRREVIGGEGDHTILVDAGCRNYLVILYINNLNGAVQVELRIHLDRYCCLVTLCVALKGNVVGEITGIHILVRICSVGGYINASNARRSDYSAGGLVGQRLICDHRHSIGAFNHLCIDRIAITTVIVGGIIPARGLQAMLTFSVVTVDHNAVVGDFESGHSQGIVGIVLGISNITGVHVIEVERVLLGLTLLLTGLAEPDAVLGGQENRTAAKIAVVVAGVVVTKQEEDGQTLIRSRIHRIIQIFCIHTITVIICTVTIMQGQMGNDEDRLVGGGFQSSVQIIGQIISQALNAGRGAIAVGIVVLVQDKGTIAIKIMSAGSIDSSMGIVMISLY